MPNRVLTEQARAERAEFMDEYGTDGNCCCHLGAAPCGSCTHPGNPRNQDEDESCWVEEQPAESATPTNRVRVSLISITTADGKRVGLAASDLRLAGYIQNIDGERVPRIELPMSVSVTVQINPEQQEALRKWIDEATRKDLHRLKGTPLERPARVKKAQWKRERSKFHF